MTANSQAAGLFYAGPVSGAAAAPSFRAIQASDLPSITPSGAAGGDLGGTYPNPIVNNDSHSHTATTLPGATTSTPGVVELATSGETAPGLAVQADDERLANERVPTDHASSHAQGQGDALSGTLAVSISGNAATASAFDHDPDPCPDGEVASGIAADGSLTCVEMSSGSPDVIELPTAGSAQSASQIVAGLGTRDLGLLFGRGQAGNAVAVIVGGSPFTLWDGNSNRMTLKGNMCVRWGDTYNDAYGGAELCPIDLDGTRRAIEVRDLLRLNPIAAAPSPCDSAHEGSLYYNLTIHKFCGCDGTTWTLLNGDPGSC